MHLKKHENNPILSPNPNHDWENEVTTNPTAWYDEKDKEVKLLYRCLGKESTHVTRIALATSKDGYNFERFDEPVFCPRQEGFDTGVVEDPRMVKIGDWYYITYASVPFAPGKYWENGGNRYICKDLPDEFPSYMRENATVTGLAATRDFEKFYRFGRITNTLVAK